MGPRAFQIKSPQDAAQGQVRVMIVDDSLTVRTVFSRMIGNDPKLELTATASNAERAIAILRDRPVDVILLDLEMPGMGGLEALPRILEIALGAQVLVVSSLTEDGAEHTLTALSMGAADTMAKPRPGQFDDSYRRALLAKIHALGGVEADDVPGHPREGAIDHGAATAISRSNAKQPEVLAIGGSTGAIQGLNTILRSLPLTFDLPILVTQHLPASFISVFARQVEVVAARRTVIAEDGVEIARGEIAIATGHGHMLVERARSRLVARVSNVPSRSGCLPSVDPMLASVAETFDGHALAVILSGMGRDGAEGAARLAAAGGTVLAQDQESSAVWGMPGAAVKQGAVHACHPPEALAREILEFAGAVAWK